MAKSKSKGAASRSARLANAKKKGKPEPAARATMSGPAAPSVSVDSPDDLAAKMAGTDELAAAFPYNANKQLEYDPAAALRPQPGASAEPADPIVGASTITEMHGSEKVGSGGPPIGNNKTIAPLDRVRV